MAEIKSNPEWSALKADRQIATLLESDGVTRFNDIIDILVTNKSVYLSCGVTEDVWLDRTYMFKYQGCILNPSTAFEDAEPVFNRTFLSQQEVSWFTDERLNASTHYCISFFRENWLSWVASNPGTHDDGSTKGPTTAMLENSSWLDSDTKALQDKLLSLPYSKYSYTLKMMSIYKNHYEPATRYDAMDEENKYVLANLTSAQQTDLLIYVRETYSRLEETDLNTIAELETACEMLEFDISQQ
tara:strand:- start:1231 stop:1959 length:729 start_codon:yes stop_codon:yes gene_type:complete